jgi:hypothetical protein
MLQRAANGTDYAGARLEDIVVVDQEGIVRYWTNATGDLDFPKIKDMVDALINKSPVINLSLRQIYFGTELGVGQSKTVTLKIDNTGAGALNITGYSAPAEVTVEPSKLSIGVNESKSVQITLTPTQTGTFSGSITLEHNDSSVPTLQVPFRTIDVLSNDPTNGTISVSLSGSAIVVLADPRTDFNGSGVVDFPDFLAFVQVFGTANATFDLNGSGLVDFVDFLTFAQNFGKSVN